MSTRTWRNAAGKVVTVAVPLTAPERATTYRAQNHGAEQLTPRQRRRARHKANRAARIGGEPT